MKRTLTSNLCWWFDGGEDSTHFAFSNLRRIWISQPNCSWNLVFFMIEKSLSTMLQWKKIIFESLPTKGSRNKGFNSSSENWYHSHHDQTASTIPQKMDLSRWNCSSWTPKGRFSGQWKWTMEVSDMFYFHPSLKKWSNLTVIFFKWVGWQPPPSGLLPPARN